MQIVSKTLTDTASDEWTLVNRPTGQWTGTMVIPAPTNSARVWVALVNTGTGAPSSTPWIAIDDPSLTDVDYIIELNAATWPAGALMDSFVDLYIWSEAKDVQKVHTTFYSGIHVY